MVNIPRGKSDAIIEELVAALQQYESDHPAAQIDLYRQNSVSVRIRIIDPDLAKFNRPERNQLVWKYLDQISENAQADISILLLLTPDETKNSFANFEFEDPVPSQL